MSRTPTREQVDAAIATLLAAGARITANGNAPPIDPSWALMPVTVFLLVVLVLTLLR